MKEKFIPVTLRGNKRRVREELDRCCEAVAVHRRVLKPMRTSGGGWGKPYRGWRDTPQAFCHHADLAL
jgi:hypothetical protein